MTAWAAGAARIASWTGQTRFLLGLLPVFAVLLAARSPDALLHAGFWAEDGWVWYPDAYQYGPGSLARPVAGYLQTVSRLVGLLAQPFPLAWAPAVFASAALVLQVLPPLFLMSSRMAGAWPDACGRLLFALLWLALPNAQEVYVNLTNAQWHLAALAFLVLLSRPPAGWPARALDASALIVSGLSGPFCVLLAPVAAWLAMTRRDGTSLRRAAAVLAAAAVQSAFLLSTLGERSADPLGAGPRLLARIVSQQVVLGALAGQANMGRLQSLAAWQGDILPLLGVAVATGLTALALASGPVALRLAVLAAGLLFAAAMSHPQISTSGAQWPPMQTPGVGQRYYYVPMLAWLAVLFTLAGSRAWWRRVLGAGPLLVLAIGLWSDWSIPPRPRTEFAAQVRAFEAAAPGTAVAFSFPPLFDRQPMVLVKR